MSLMRRQGPHNVVAAMCWVITGPVGGSCVTAPERRGPSEAGVFHTLGPGETVEDLARKSGLSVEEIVEVNGLTSAKDVTTGQVLFLPAGGRVEAGVEPRASPQSQARRDVPAQTVAPASASAVLAWPVDGVVLRSFSTGRIPYDGLLLAAPEGFRVHAAADGEVLFAGDQGTAFGLVVVVRHADDLVTVYGHLGESQVRAGDRLRVGQVIGAVGMSGGQDSPRLHFQVRRGRTAVDPRLFLPLN